MILSNINEKYDRQCVNISENKHVSGQVCQRRQNKAPKISSKSQRAVKHIKPDDEVTPNVEWSGELPCPPCYQNGQIMRLVTNIRYKHKGRNIVSVLKAGTIHFRPSPVGHICHKQIHYSDSV